MTGIYLTTTAKTMTKKGASNMAGWRPIKQSEKLKHYTQIANGTKLVDLGSKYTMGEQIAYARGQRDARNEARRIFAIKNATPEQRKAYKEKKKANKPKFKNIF